MLLLCCRAVAVSRAMRERGPPGQRIVLVLLLLPSVLLATSLDKGKSPCSLSALWAGLLLSLVSCVPINHHQLMPMLVTMLHFAACYLFLVYALIREWDELLIFIHTVFPMCTAGSLAPPWKCHIYNSWYTGRQVISHLSEALQTFVGPWPLFQFLNFFFLHNW
jgi:hypothetical protein